MKLENLENTGDSIFSHIIRLYNFDNQETLKLTQAISSNLIEMGKDIKLHEMDFVKSLNCELIFQLSAENYGIIQNDNTKFVCKMKKASFNEMIIMLQDSLTSNGFYWLDNDSKSEISLLYSQGGGW